MASKRFKADPQRGFPNSVDIAAAVGLILDDKFSEIVKAINELSVKVDDSFNAIQLLQTKLDERPEGVQAEGQAFPLDQLMTSVTEALGNIATEVKTSFVQTMEERERSRHAARTSTTGTTAEADAEPYVTINWENADLHVYLPASVREALAVETVLRGILRVTLRHFHPIKELRNFTLKGSGVGDSDADASGEDEVEPEAMPKVPVPAKTLAIALAIANKCKPLSSIVQRSDPQTYALLMSSRQTEVRKLASRIFQYFRNRYDKNGELKPEKRNTKKNTNSPKTVSKPGVSTAQ